MVRYPAPVKTLAITVGATGTPVRCSPVSATFTKAWIVGVKTARTANTGTVYLGTGTTDDSQFLPITTGATLVLEAPPSQLYDWYQIFLDVATAGDGIMAFYS